MNDSRRALEKRNVDALLAGLDPGSCDLELLGSLFDRYATPTTPVRGSARSRSPRWSGPKRPPVFDEFAACGMTSIGDLDCALPAAVLLRLRGR